MKNTYITFVLLAFCSSPHYANASPAYPYPVTIKQPNGKTITVLLGGDERNKRIRTTDGYTLIQGKSNSFEYAMLDGSYNLIPSGIVASNIGSRTESETVFLRSSKRGLQYSESQKQSRLMARQNTPVNQTQAFPTTGNRKLLCILIGFSDLPFTKTQAAFNNLFNLIGYSSDGASGSVRDYYLDNSYDQLDLTVTVAGPYTASQSMAYYGANLANGDDTNPKALVTEAVTLADADVNYADFDNDGDGNVDGVYVIYAGYGEEAGASTDAIWAHAWDIPLITLDGKTVSNYSCSSELLSNTGTTTTSIGVICHEFGHVIGAPDYYDTDYEKSGGEYPGTLEWDIMGSGAWNNNGKTPAHHNGYTKTHFYSWATPQSLTSTQSVIVNAATSTKTNAFYTIPTQLNGEFFFLENRQKVGFDSAIPASGLLIYRVATDIEIRASANTINTEYPQRMYLTCAGATTEPSATPISYGESSSSTLLKSWPFPGSTGKTSFSDETTPSAKSSNGLLTGLAVTNILENTTAKTVTFTITKSDTQVDPNPKPDIICYPVPFSINLNVISVNPIKSVMVYDVSGKLLIYQEASKEAIQTIKTENLASGYYLIKITNVNENTTTIKTVKQ